MDTRIPADRLGIRLTCKWKTKMLLHLTAPSTLSTGHATGLAKKLNDSIACDSAHSEEEDCEADRKIWKEGL